jgi:hypothetical protein
MSQNSKRPGLTEKQKREEIKRLLHFLNHEMDWDAFWAKVAAKSAPEIEAYRRARAGYLKHPHVLLSARPQEG